MIIINTLIEICWIFLCFFPRFVFDSFPQLQLVYCRHSRWVNRWRTPVIRPHPSSWTARLIAWSHLRKEPISIGRECRNRRGRHLIRMVEFNKWKSSMIDLSLFIYIRWYLNTGAYACEHLRWPVLSCWPHPNLRTSILYSPLLAGYSRPTEHRCPRPRSKLRMKCKIHIVFSTKAIATQTLRSAAFMLPVRKNLMNSVDFRVLNCSLVANIVSELIWFIPWIYFIFFW